MHRIKLSSCLFLAAAIMLSVTGCRKKDDLTDRVDKMNFISDLYQINGPIDQWLFDKFTVPYNIRIQYKWDRSKVDLSKTMTPVDEARVIPVGEKLLKYYLEPYQAEAGDYFVKKYPPKEYLFVGSPEYNTNGTITLGSADAGRKVILFRLNEINDDEWSSVQRMLKTVHHEFAHIMDQTRAVPPEYGSLNKADYVDDLWPDFDEQEGHDLGFVSKYARKVKSEDFAEMVAILLVYGQANFDAIVANAAPTGREKLRKKEEMVVDYFKLNWDIDFRSLQQRIQDLMPATAEPPMPPFLDTYGDGKEFNTIMVQEESLMDDFIPVWTAINDETVQKDDRHLAYMRIIMQEGNDQISARVYRYQAGEGPQGRASFSRLYFDMTEGPDGTVTFSYAAAGKDGSNSSTALKNVMTYFVDFMTTNTFTWDWRERDATQGGLHVLDSNGEKTGVAMTGVLEN